MATVEERFWRKVAKSDGDGCWAWQGMKNRPGYGLLKVAGRRALAHRWSWSQANGREIPPGMVIQHRCDNPACVRPDHLRLGTHAENRADCVAKGRQARREKHGRAKLEWWQVQLIRLWGYDVPRAWHVRAFGVDHKAVRRVLKGETWRGLTGEINRHS